MMAANAAGRAERVSPEIEEEARQLITDLRAAAQDGRALARRYAELLEKVVEEYCVEFEKRAEQVLAKWDAQ
jgi:hypothetical protein